MKRHLELPPRLQLLADWVPLGARLADVGTDHALLPVWLLLQERISWAVGSDLRPGPLAHARRTAREYGVAEKMDFHLCDGLSGIDPEEVDTVVIAGMGGENIAAILAAAPWTRERHCTLLLQPMSRPEALRSFLASRGYAIRQERLVEDRNTIYPVLLATAGEMTLSLGERYGGVGLSCDPLQGRFLREQIVRLFQALSGLKRSRVPEDRQKVRQVRDLITAFMAMREEWRDDNSSEN